MGVLLGLAMGLGIAIALCGLFTFGAICFRIVRDSIEKKKASKKEL